MSAWPRVGVARPRIARKRAGLARAVGAKHPGDAPGRDGEGEVVDGEGVAVPDGEGLDGQHATTVRVAPGGVVRPWAYASRVTRRDPSSAYPRNMIDVTGLRPRRPAAPRSLREQQQLQLLLDAVAGAVYAAGALAILARHLVSPGVTVLGVVLVVAAAALARQRPVLAVAVAVAVLWLAPLDDGLAWLGAPALAYAAFRAAERSPARIGAAALAVALTGPAATALPSFRHAGGVLPFGLLIVAAWAIGTAVLRRRQEQEQRLHAHVADERLRIARELHDVVAHSISAITVQAGYARLTLERDSARTVEALEAIESTGRHTLDELRTLLGVLRTAPPLVPSLRPAPTLADLPALLEQANCLRPRPGSATQNRGSCPGRTRG